MHADRVQEAVCIGNPADRTVWYQCESRIHRPVIQLPACLKFKMPLACPAPVRPHCATARHVVRTNSRIHRPASYMTVVPKYTLFGPRCTFTVDTNPLVRLKTGTRFPRIPNYIFSTMKNLPSGFYLGHVTSISVSRSVIPRRDPMDQIPSRNAGTRSADQEIRRPLWKIKVSISCTQQPILRHNPVPTFTLSTRVTFNIILPSVPRSPRLSSLHVFQSTFYTSLISPNTI